LEVLAKSNSTLFRINGMRLHSSAEGPRDNLPQTLGDDCLPTRQCLVGLSTFFLPEPKGLLIPEQACDNSERVDNELYRREEYINSKVSP
jgi:hypothetical protein